MTNERHDSLEHALCAFRLDNGLNIDEASNAFWRCRIGFANIVLPNFRWRRRAIVAHDLHHVLTGYRCTLHGECLMAAWEFGAGGMRHWGPTLFCQPLVLLGFLWTPRQTISAFRHGCGYSNLHNRPIDNQLLQMSFAAANAELRVPKDDDDASPILLRFSRLLLKSTLLCLSYLLILAAFGWLVVRL